MIFFTVEWVIDIYSLRRKWKVNSSMKTNRFPRSGDVTITLPFSGWRDEDELWEIRARSQYFIWSRSAKAFENVDRAMIYSRLRSKSCWTLLTPHGVVPFRTYFFFKGFSVWERVSVKKSTLFSSASLSFKSSSSVCQKSSLQYRGVRQADN